MTSRIKKVVKYAERTGWSMLAAALLLIPVIYAMAEEAPAMDDSVTAQPQLVYQAKGRRDPFVQPQAGRLRGVMEKVNIEDLRLTGVFRNPKQAMALFASQTGPKFGYLLKGEVLYRENHEPVPGVTGKVINPKKVLLKQGDKQIVFKLRTQ